MNGLTDSETTGKHDGIRVVYLFFPRAVPFLHDSGCRPIQRSWHTVSLTSDKKCLLAAVDCIIHYSFWV